MFLFENRKLYNSIRKYGWKNFEKEIVEVVYCRTEVLELEKFYIAEIDTFKNGLNSTPGGEDGWLRGDSPSAVPVRSYNIKTGEEQMFECILDAAEEFDLDANGISKVVRKIVKRTGDYMFQRCDSNKPFDPDSVLTRAEVRQKAAAASREINKIAVIGTHFTGFSVEFEALIDARRELGISDGHIVDCCRGKRGYAGDYMWHYKDYNIAAQYQKFVAGKTGKPSRGKVYRLILDGIKDIYDSANAAQKKLHIRHVQRCIENGWKSGGYFWYALDENEYKNRPKQIKHKGKVYRILEDGTKDIYDSSFKAERALNIKHVRRAVETNGKAGGCQWYAV
jgi:hypothetical protein